MDQFYLLEIIIEKIDINDDVPLKVLPKENDQFKIGVVFADLINTEILIKDVRGLSLDTDVSGRHIEPSQERSILFASKPNNLLAVLSKFPLELSLKTPVAPFVIGRVNVPWIDGFHELIRMGETQTNEVIPFSVFDSYVINNMEEPTGALGILLKLTSYGECFQTQFQIVPRENVVGGLSPKKYFFKNMNTTIVFKAQIYEVKGLEKEVETTRTCQPTCRQGTTKVKPKPENFTKTELNKILCKHKNCNATKEFARFGIGPAAKTSKVDGLNEVVIPHGMCHAYSKLKNYGPNSIYLRPRTIEGPFVGKHSELFSSPEYIEAVTAFLMRKRDNMGPCICTCDCEPGDNLRPQPALICWNLLQAYDNLINVYRKMVGLPLLKPTTPPVCNNPDCPMINKRGTQFDFTSCMPVLEQVASSVQPIKCTDPNCPANFKPPCHSCSPPCFQIPICMVPFCTEMPCFLLPRQFPPCSPPPCSSLPCSPSPCLPPPCLPPYCLPSSCFSPPCLPPSCSSLPCMIPPSQAISCQDLFKQNHQCLFELFCAPPKHSNDLNTPLDSVSEIIECSSVKYEKFCSRCSFQQ